MNHSYHLDNVSILNGRWLIDLSNLKPFGTVCWIHVKKARRQGKTDIELRGEQGILVGYDDDQGPLLARVYFPATGAYELHGDGYIQYQSFTDQLIGVYEPKQEVLVECPMEDYHMLVGFRHIDPKNGLAYETVDIKITPNSDIVAWRWKVIKGSLQNTPQGPFHAEDIY